jgi:tetratricopeptide (TPR) repeat protein
MQGRFRWKAILFLILGLAVFGTAWFFLQRFQISSIHSRFLDQVARAEETGNTERAARFLKQYLSVKRDDVDARARYGVLIEQLAASPQALAGALGVYEGVLEQDPSRREIRLRAAKLHKALGGTKGINKALEHLGVLYQADPSDPEVNLLLGQCKWGKKQLEKDALDKVGEQKLLSEAEGHFKKSIDKGPHNLEAYSWYARLLRDEQIVRDLNKKSHPREAADVLGSLIKANPQEERAFLIRSQFRENAYVDIPVWAARMWGLSKTPFGQNHLVAGSALYLSAVVTDWDGAGQDLAQARKLVGEKLAALKGPSSSNPAPAATAPAASGQSTASGGRKSADDKAREKTDKEYADVYLASAIHETLLARAATEEKDKNAHLEEARTHLDLAAKLFPKDTRILSQHAQVELLAQRSDEALNLFRKVEKKATDSATRNAALWKLAILLIDSHIPTDLLEAESVIDQMKKGGVPSYRLDYLRAKVVIERGKWGPAIDLLEAARPLLVDNPALVLDTDLLLSSCYQKLNNWDQQLDICKRARKNNPLRFEPRYGIVNALVSLGRLDEAIEECQELEQMPSTRAAIALTYANLLATKGRFDEAVKILQAARNDDALKANPAKAAEIDVLLAQVELAAGKSEEQTGDNKDAREKYQLARKILEEAKNRTPLAVGPWVALADLAARMNGEAGSAEAMKILKEAKEKCGDSAELRLAMVRYAPAKKGENNKEAIAFLRPLAEKLDGFERGIQGRLWAALAQAFYDAGDSKEAEQCWQALAHLEPNQLQVRLVLFDFYYRTKNAVGMGEALNAIQEIEGPKGPFWHYAKAMLLISKAREGEKQLLPEAREHLVTAQAKRPRWPRLFEALAAVAEIEGKDDLAVSHLREAVTFGSRELPVVRLLVAKLMARGQFSDADDVLRKLQEVGPIGDDLQKLAAQISIMNEAPERALELAQNAVADDSKNYKDHLWKGQLLASVRKYSEAEGALKKAAELAPEVPDSWVALVQVQAANNALKEANDTIASMKAKLPSARLPFALALCYRAIKENAMAERAYQQALAAQPNNLDILQGAASFQLAKGAGGKVEPYLRAILDPGKRWATFDGQEVKVSDDLKSWARRHLAMSIGFQGIPEKHREALSLVGENLKTNPSNLDDQIAKGMLLKENAETRAEAIRILEKAFKNKQPAPAIEQMYMLATLYENELDWPKARQYMVFLLATHTKHAKYYDYLARFVGLLVFHGELNEADLWLRRLQEVDAQSFPTVDCLVRYYAKRLNSEEVLKPIKGYLESKGPKPAEALSVRLIRATVLLNDVVQRYPEVMNKKNLLEGEKLLRESARQIGTKESLLNVASYLASCQRLEESLDLCEQLLKDLPHQQVVLTATTAVAISNKPSPQQVARVEAWVKAGQKEDPKAVEWDGYLAALKERQEKFSEAELLYRKILEQRPQDVVAINNLAFLLGVQGKGNEAFGWIQKLDAVAGHMGEILDTRAVILRSQGKLQEAGRDLREALRQQKTPYRLFHLAQVYQSAKDIKKTVEIFEQAKQLGLRSEMVHPLERESFQAMALLAEQSR